MKIPITYYNEQLMINLYYLKFFLDKHFSAHWGIKSKQVFIP